MGDGRREVSVITTLTDVATTWQKVGLCTLRAAL
jgi:hypothetical protein